MNLPNLITVIRILLTPVLIILLLNASFNKALAVFALAGLSDGLDGFLARYLRQKTTLGAYLDPIADKLLLSATFITLATLKLVPSWLTVIIVSRDVIIVLGIAMLFVNGSEVPIRPSIISKITTLLQIMAVFVILSRDLWAVIWQMRDTLVWLTTVFTVLSGLHYIYFGVKIFSSANEK
ncbi:MAG: CDP-diacylglycerol--glycerol-3-phosphate 3-phosphatidyltransferase [Deltaproteobacteria bacterium]|jgi:cardiolipin synthase|nr:MAG: CDP-diacylglycerol--glycerol-3-phosphate 3-phosphatidyltransferase [Deltaproteobacteria bacterium]